MEYNKLEERWRPLIHKFSTKYTIPGYDIEDISQELRVVLLRADQLYDPSKGTKFITYLYSAFDSKCKKIYRDVQGRKKHIPENIINHISGGYDYLYKKEESNYDNIDLFTGLSFSASQIVALVLEGKEKKKEWKASGMTKEDIRLGLIELRHALKGGQK